MGTGPLTQFGSCAWPQDPPNAESSLYAEVQPVLAISKRKVSTIIMRKQEIEQHLCEVVATGAVFLRQKKDNAAIGVAKKSQVVAILLAYS